MQLKICWPNPDATCLEGGCTYCPDGEWVNVTDVAAYAREIGDLQHRGGQVVDAYAAFAYGQRTNWFNQVKRDHPGGRPFTGSYDRRTPFRS